jgi:dipeptidyl aminopeptidase/acylaminoacyl peptidase
MRRLALVLAAALGTLAVAAPALAAPRAIVPEDLFRMQFVEDAQISHDGSRVAFIVRRADLTSNGYLTAIWIANTDGSRVAQLTQGKHDAEPAWSPDDTTLAFTRAQGGPPQLYTIALAGGEARQLTHAKNGASTAVWSHDGRRIAFSSTTIDDAAPSHVDWHALGVKAPDKYAKTDIRTIPWPRYEANGAGPIYDKHQHIWTIGADGTGAKQITDTAPGEQLTDWSPDDATLVYGTDALDDVEGDAGQLFEIPSAGGTAHQLALPHYGAFGALYTHDGKHLVYGFLSHHDSAGFGGLAEAKSDATGDRIVVAENAMQVGDNVINDTKEIGAGCQLIAHDDATMIADYSVPGATELDAVSLADGTHTRIVGGDREIQDCSASADDRTIAFTSLDATHVAELSVIDRRTGTIRQLTHLNDALMSSLAIAEPQMHTVANGQGGTVAYWVLRPPNVAADAKTPVILDIHGGPLTDFGAAFFDEFQVLAARGYTVVYANPRGSAGYGYDWSEALAGNWGDAMMTDEMAVMDDVGHRTDVDMTHAFVSGGSYGGYATLWVIAHTNRFKAALAERPVSDLFTEQLSADFAAPRGFEGTHPHDWGGPLAGHDVLWQQSPVAHVTDVHTPLMLFHGDNDTRTPIAETLQEYEALKMLGRTVELVQFPRENHDLSRTGEPIHRIERLKIMEQWFDAHLK